MYSRESKPPGGTFAGFDGLRLFGAVAVMFSHAYLIARGSEDTEPFIRLLGPGNLLGLYGVFTFFIISGFLLTRSLQARPDAITYSVNRTLRILPGFLFCTLVTVAVIGPLFSSLTLPAYLSSPQTAEYVTKSIATLNDAYLPGVYVDSGAEVHMVANGALWSLHYEALSYVFLLFLWTVAPFNVITAVVAVTLSAVTWIFPPVGEWIASVAYTLPYFSGGVLMHWIHSRYGTTPTGAVVSLVLLLASCVFGVQLYAFAVFGAYLIVFLGERPNIGSAIARKIGDCSYGVYLFGWPAEQMMRKMTHTTNPLGLFLMALPLALMLGWISFHLVEKPAMRLRAPVAAWIWRAISRALAAMGRARAGVVGAKVAFVVGAAVLLTSKVQWWYFTESIGLLILATVAGSMVFMAMARGAGFFRRA